MDELDYYAESLILAYSRLRAFLEQHAAGDEAYRELAGILDEATARLRTITGAASIETPVVDLRARRHRAIEIRLSVPLDE